MAASRARPAVSTWWGSAKLALPEGVTLTVVRLQAEDGAHSRGILVIFPDQLQQIVDHAGTRDVSVVEVDSDHYGLPASGTGEDVIKQVGDTIKAWPATHNWLKGDTRA
ncbi:MAG TPA: hypothetical protein VHZ03_06200 [Trebonia sp.]|nr:hypothetical protein [Trebonia sp.]